MIRPLANLERAATNWQVDDYRHQSLHSHHDDDDDDECLLLIAWHCLCPSRTRLSVTVLRKLTLAQRFHHFVPVCVSLTSLVTHLWLHQLILVTVSQDQTLAGTGYCTLNPVLQGPGKDSRNGLGSVSARNSVGLFCSSRMAWSPHGQLVGGSILASTAKGCGFRHWKK